jgi:hypothetical protein
MNEAMGTIRGRCINNQGIQDILSLNQVLDLYPALDDHRLLYSPVLDLFFYSHRFEMLTER